MLRYVGMVPAVIDFIANIRYNGKHPQYGHIG